jgi:tetratricopeptide (TPR) repeat protein
VSKTSYQRHFQGGVMPKAKLLFLFLIFVILNLTCFGQADQNSSLEAKKALALVDLGNQQYEAGNYQESIITFTKALKFYPEFPEALNSLCASHARLKQHTEALQYCQGAIKNKPDFVIAYYNSGRVLDELGRIQEAMDMFREAIRLKPDYAPAYYDLGGDFYLQGSYDLALDYLQSAARFKPNDAEIQFLLGSTFYKLKRYNEAFEAINKSIQIKPTSFCFANLGVVLVAQNKFSRAIESFQESLKLDPEKADVHYWLGIAYYRTNKEKLALEHFEKAIFYKPDFADAHHGLGLLYLKIRKKDEAITQYKRLKSLDGELASILFKQIFADKILSVPK